MTPRAITAPELAKLRSNGQWSKVKMIIDNPDTVYTARVSVPLLNTDYSILFTSGSGTIGNCLGEMTLLIGSTAGGSDKGIARLRETASGSSFKVGADLSLDTEVNDYLTVINDFRIFAKHDHGTLLDVTVEYTDQFSSFVPNAVVDGGRISVIDAGETAVFDASDSWVLGSTISSYAWTFTGASSTTNTTTATPTATYNTSGRYRWKLVVTAANAKTTTVYGFVYVLGDNLAAETDFIVDEIEGTEDGWACTIKCYDRPTIYDGVRVTLFAEDYYANAAGSIGPVTGKENIIFTGWIIGETIVRDPQKEIVEFEVGGPLTVCSRVFSKPAGLVNPAFPTDSAATITEWSKMTSLTAAKAVHYLANYRSNLAVVCDVYSGDWGYPVHKLSTDATNLLAQLDDFANNSVQTVRADRFGVINIERDGQMYAIADRTANIPVVMTLTDTDWQEDLAIVRRQTGEVAMAEVEGYIFASGILTPVGGRSPGNFPAHYGDLENRSEMNFTSQANALEFAGLLAGSRNAEIESIIAILASNNRFIDTGKRQFVDVTVDGDLLRCYPRRVVFRRVEGTGFWMTELELEPEGGQWDAVAIDYPGDDGGGGGGGGGEEEEPPVYGNLDAIVTITDDIKVSADFDQASPTWTTEKTSLPSGTIIDSVMASELIQYVITETKIYKSGDITVVGAAGYSELYDAASFTLGTDLKLLRIITSKQQNNGDAETVYALGYAVKTGSTYAAYCGVSNNKGVSWNWYEIGEIEAPGEGFTVTGVVDAGGGNSTMTASGGDGTATLTINFVNHAYPICRYSATVVLDTEMPDGDPLTIEYDVTGDSPSDGYDTDGDLPAYVNYLIAEDKAVTGSFSGSAGNYHFSGSINTHHFADKKTLQIGWFYGREGRWGGLVGATTRTSTISNLVIGGVSYGSNVSSAFDVAWQNKNWLYYGATDKIWKSEDGGVTWTAMNEDYGAYDVFVDPLIAGALYFWTTDGELRLSVGGVVEAAALDTETPYNQYMRIAKTSTLGTLWTLTGGGKIRARINGEWVDKQTGVVSGRSLIAYSGGTGLLIFLGASHVHYSDDGGDTWAAKEGDFSEYSGNGIAAELLPNWYLDEAFA